MGEWPFTFTGVDGRQIAHCVGRAAHDIREGIECSAPEDIRSEMLQALREILLNAMEHGAAFNPEQVVEVRRGAETSARLLRQWIFRRPSSALAWRFSPNTPRYLSQTARLVFLSRSPVQSAELVHPGKGPLDDPAPSA